MKKNTSLIFLFIIYLVGSILAYYNTNFLFSDISNSFRLNGLLVTFPGLIISMDFVLIILFIARSTINPNYLKSMLKVYSIILGVLSIFGLITSILAGTLVYKTFVGTQPFKGYLILSIIIHLSLLALSIYALFKLVKTMEDKESKKISVKYILYTIYTALFIYFSMYRFGSFLYLPFIISSNSLVFSIPLCLSLLLPFAFLAIACLYRMGYFKDNKKGFIASLVLSCLFVTFMIFIVIGFKDTEFVEILIHLFSLDGLTSKPLEVSLHFITAIPLGIYLIVKFLKNMKEEKEAV